MNSVRLTVLLLVLFFSAGLCRAQDAPKREFDGALIVTIGGLGGSSERTPPAATGGTWAAGTHAFGYSVGYRQQLNRLLSGAVTYVNQGHYDRHSYETEHHSRDDIQGQIFVGKRPRNGPFDFKIGAGGAYYSETDVTGTVGNAFVNHHGFGVVVSGVVDVDITDRIFVETIVHRHFVFDRFDSTNVLFGVGYRMQTREPDDQSNGAGPSRHSIRVSYGYGKLNGRRSESLRRAFQVAYQNDLSRRFGVAVSFVREGQAAQLDRKGVAIQGQVRQEFAGPLTIGLGLGPYINVDHSDFYQRKGEVSVDSLFTVFIDIRVATAVELGLSVNRPRSLSSLEDKPMTDVFQMGLKFRL